MDDICSERDGTARGVPGAVSAVVLDVVDDVEEENEDDLDGDDDVNARETDTGATDGSEYRSCSVPVIRDKLIIAWCFDLSVSPTFQCSVPSFSLTLSLSLSLFRPLSLSVSLDEAVCRFPSVRPACVSRASPRTRTLFLRQRDRCDTV